MKKITNRTTKPETSGESAKEIQAYTGAKRCGLPTGAVIDKVELFYLELQAVF
ncbi:hypothetical protein PF010_g33382 [Phytophthora fragariae]|uniref:Uncharacterized protein n=1 Tax=Phytophthora fragariae TaxID=53985 RepID=A0A6A3FWG8_9STRA|nr:hypothetical protein PF003_g28379 [Phytophthora fragariae]KAE8950565.1 hypothetical protein PF011_g33195 [Phytophthora fragariae]KAE9034055.1 hypothetical protein PF010_g33382 [Phytophthora fragariae]KAE9050294.1 hypothetical protein PF007_g33120 [Phytophthora fragariae]KAE9142810.1 hypothetical protein PF004_g33117 [Phytophthora fragariae]